MKQPLFLLLMACAVSQTYAQSSVYQTSPDRAFNEALDLFQKDQFSASKFSFEYLKAKPLDEAQKIDVDFYHAVSALYLENPDGDGLLNEFLLNYPHEPKANDAAHILGDFYFQKRDYRGAIESFRKVNTDRANAAQQADVLFKTGYSFFQLKDYQNASPYFEQVKRSRSEYLPDAYYYAGYIAMEAGDFNKAIQDFKEAEKSPTYSSKVP